MELLLFSELDTSDTSDTRSTYGVISKNAWGIIAHELTVQDLIQLRGTCRHMNTIIKSMNARWYRAYQWFVGTKVSKSKVKSAVKCHPKDVAEACIRRSHPTLAGMSYYEQYNAKRRLIRGGAYTTADCKNRSCWQYKVPTREQDIPLDKNYKGKRNRYIYWYLIECYRYYKKDQNDTIKVHQGGIKHQQQDRERMKREIKYLKQSIASSITSEAASEEKLAVAVAKYQENAVFEGKRINCYKGV